MLVASSEGALPGPCPMASGSWGRVFEVKNRGSRPVQQEMPARYGALHGLGCLSGAYTWSNHRRKVKRPRTMHGSAVPGSLSCTRQDLLLSTRLLGPHCPPTSHLPPWTLGEVPFSVLRVSNALTSGLMGALTRHKSRLPHCIFPKMLNSLRVLPLCGVAFILFYL